MSSPLLRPVLRGALRQVRQVDPVRPRRAPGEVRAVYTEVEREFGMLAPPIALHAAAPAVMAAAWVMLRETLIAGGLVERAAKEAVAAAVSAENSCPYCVDVHGAALDALLPGADATKALDGPSEWLRRDGGAPPFPAAHAPELVGTAVVFHYLNRMVNLFLADGPVPENAPPAVRRMVHAMLGRLMRAGARQAPVAGGSLDLLPSAPLPADLRWAAGTPSVAGAFARAAAVAEDSAARVAPATVRALLDARLATWDGRPPGLGRGWVDPAVAELPPEDRPAGRLALLTAMASYQVDEALVAEFRHRHPGDAPLIELTSWAAFTAARRLGTRLADAD
ncbi:carboxymuconolactone decarboxylase family protein [Kitasatospora sp. NPDC092948]|uniref:carboxymuconolactone decarboxylase family protein n=1 Tax=Kitasatospora sp. NPDC092948 TaxID=3364088 RepID=UPI003818DC6B